LTGYALGFREGKRLSSDALARQSRQLWEQAEVLRAAREQILTLDETPRESALRRCLEAKS
jgi:hypothetical protein